MTFEPLPLRTAKEDEFEPLPLRTAKEEKWESLPYHGKVPKEEEEFESLPLRKSENQEFEPLPLRTYKEPPPVTEEAPFMAKHPNLYGAYGAVKETAKTLIPYAKYIDPAERKEFLKLDKQHQVRDLLLQDLEAVAFAAAGPIGKGIAEIAAPALKKFLPKTYKLLTKSIGKAKVKTPPIEIEVAPEVQKVMDALKGAKPIRAEQEAIYTKARGERINKAIEAGDNLPGEKGYYAKLSKMKNKMDQVEFHSIREEVGQEGVDSLFNQIHKSAKLDEFEKLTAGRGLAKLFGEFGGTVPQEKEIALLGKEFGGEFTKTMMSKRSLWAKAKDVGLEVANIPRAIMASFDLSAPLRQGVFLVGRPKQWAPAFKDMFKYAFSEKSFAKLGEEIAARPTYKLMKESRLAITELGSKMSVREEEFMSSMAEKIPIIGRGVRISSRAYTGFLNKLRADVFDDIVKKGAGLGIKDPKFLKDAANFINHATGRGTLGGFEKAAVPLNAFFFSPRLIASRLNLLNPVFYAKLHPQARKEALKSLFTFGAAASTVGGLMSMGGAKVGVDPRSADFMKLKFGNKRYDILGGFQQPIRMAAQVIMGEVVSSTTGKVITLGEGYKPLTRTDIISRFAESKEAPVFSFATALLRGQTSLGEKVDVPTEVANRFVPMAIQDMADFYKEEGEKGLLMAAPALFGVGAMSYGGVNSYGLNGKDHPVLNKELNRLKTSMGYPSTSAFGYELTNKEYKLLKEKTGKEIAKELTKTISQPYYKAMNDRFKVQEIEQLVDSTKDWVKRETFPNKEYGSEIKASFKATEGMTEEEARQAAKDFLERRK